MSISKVKKGFLPIYAKDVRRMIGYCDTWKYGNKDTCHYVADNITDKLILSGINLTLQVQGRIRQHLIEITHDINSGGKLPRPILIDYTGERY